MANETLISSALRQELLELYRAPDRHYHGASHIEAMLNLFEANRARFADPSAVEAAIWFHDAIYDSRRSDNETKSAEFAAAKLAGHADDNRLARIAALILATATHELPEGADDAARQDAALFLDLDLSILGAPGDAFDAYEAGVRREYGWVDEAAWRAGRAAMLRKFLDRPIIFQTEIFRQRYEKTARDNIARSLTALTGQGRRG
jgi:predicted metal-dependent HD superfamily phosphohydrolase